MVYRVELRGAMVHRYDGSIDTDWAQLDDRLFASEDAACQAVMDLLDLRLPKHTHGAIRNSKGLQVTPTVYRVPESIWIIPVHVEGS